MKFKIKKKVLLEALLKVSKAISTKNLIPVLAGIKFELTKKKLILTASDNDITIEDIIYKEDNDDLLIEKEGSIIIQGKYILDIVKKLPTDVVNIEVVDDLKIIVYTENSNFNLNGIKESEYPNISLEESKNKIEIDIDSFKDIVYQTAFATSNEEAKPILTGINFIVENNNLICNSTDSYRLARKTVNLEKEALESYNIVIPSHNLLEFVKILDDKYKKIELHIFNNKVLFKYGNVKFQTRLINGTYPNTHNLIPKESTLKITVGINDFYDVIDRASILTSDKEKNVVTLETTGNTLYLRSSSVEIGRVEEKMNINKDNDSDVKISFSARYMMEALKTFSTNTVDIYFIGEVNPIIIKSSEDESLLQLVLPIRTY